jgi:hypothetical protein
VKPPQNQYTLGELMGLVALCAVAFALLTTSVAPLGVGLLIVIPGFVLERVRGGTGFIGGIVSGCLIPMGASTGWTVIEFHLGGRSIGETLNFLPALYLLFVVCLVWSSLASSILYVLDRRLQGPLRSKKPATGPADAGIRFLSDEGIRFLSDEDRPGPVPAARNAAVSPAPDPK